LSSLHILALDTTTREGSIAVARGDTLLHESAGDPARTHGERLPTDIMRALEAARIDVADLDLLAVAAGPGSFTGLRVGISAIQGLAVARALRVVPVPTLEALARAAEATSGSHTLIAAWMDGQRGEVFAAVYDAAGNEIVPATAGAPEAILHSWRLPTHTAIVFIGDAAVQNRPLIERQLGGRVHIMNPRLLAGVIAQIAAAQPHRAVSPHEIVPVYVRKSDAELARERRKGTA
jgi:tRNA threonylcarbamoyladenosine biosynthesis protein TsaB